MNDPFIQTLRGLAENYVAGESARALMDIALARRVPVGNGILTVDTEAQARKAVQDLTAKKVDIINQKLGYLVRGGDPDAIDSIVPMAYGNLALDLLLGKTYGRLVVLRNGCYDNIPIDTVTASKKVVNVKEHYNTERLRPHYKSFEKKPLFILTSETG